MSVELFDVADGARVADGVCVGTEFWNAEISDVKDASPPTGEEDGGVIGEKFEGEYVCGIIFLRDRSRADEMCVTVELVDCHNAMACPECEKDVGFFRRRG